MFWYCQGGIALKNFHLLLTFALDRVNSYWVLVGIWWCKLIELIPEGEFNSLFSHLSTSAPWTPSSTGLLVSNYWLEAGRSSQPDDTNGIHSSCLKIWTVTKQYQKLPYTFVYLFSFFLLADVRHTSLSDPGCTVFISGCSQGINTTTTLVSICQNDHFQFSFLQVTYLGLAQGITSAIR